MRAVIVSALGQPPALREFPEPEPGPGETVVEMTAAAMNPITLTRAAGQHYSTKTTVPFVVGTDGVGRTTDGRRVYVPAVRPPFGTLAERVPVPAARLVPFPDGLSDAFAAAVAIPALSCWNPLAHRAQIRPGESVLVHGATGAAGRLAIQVSKHLGAKAVVATGRDPAKLATLGELGADRVIPLGQPTEALQKAIREAVREFSVGVVLDYIFGPTAETLLSAIGGPDAPRGTGVVRYVQIGAMAGPSITLASMLLRSSALEILGSGIGSSPPEEVDRSLRDALAASSRFRLETQVHPIADVEKLWGSTGEERRIVFALR